MTTIRKYKLPEGAKARIEGTMLFIAGPKGELHRNIRFPQITVRCEGGEIVVTTESNRKKIVAMVGTIAAHAANMSKGVTTGFEYHMKVVFSHFPIQLKLAGTTLEINNFLGEKKARYAQLKAGVSAKVGTDEVVLSGIDIEAVGTTAANIEHATRIRDRDPRVFQDGIYITQRA
ncbi:MAG: 50S ribosomal protein L6 [Methanoregulaceae archaeon]|nr:50S ribosomal protein L6 [Methanoregulaceae archaeon]